MIAWTGSIILKRCSVLAVELLVTPIHLAFTSFTGFAVSALYYKSSKSETALWSCITLFSTFVASLMHSAGVLN